MKKLFFIALFATAFIGQTQAQVTFKPMFRGGLNISYFSGDNSYYYNNNGSGQYITTDYTSKTDFYLGFAGALHLTKYYTLQPELNYSRQGSNWKEGNGSGKVNVNYFSIGVINKFTFNDKFNFHIGPTIDFVVDKDKNFNTNSDLDLAFTAGLGYQIIENLGIEARIKKGIVPVVDFGSNQYNMLFSIGATYTFDVK